ncbi:MAG: hypothetical protein E6K76_01185 [Candidatus Eisenbacteria bacterium]|uniref:TrbI/VirB10 family protein n=1 Tax=Eiseniibacteriota bacterium TaxID=2212470 RepID=A0A538TAI0_UNCEI|nr:MAG: hypothetical protein E6K76_01185 [Candidatus Eisenbacteria bacterium]
MKPIRILGCSLLAVLLAFAVSACQKKAQTDMSQANDSTQIGQGYGTETPPEQTAPPEPGKQGAAPPKGTKAAHPSGSSSSGTKGSSSTPSNPSTYASERTTEIPAGTTFDIEMITPVDTRTSNTGDRVEGKLASPITIEGVVVAEAGARVSGTISDLKRASRSKSKDERASIILEFTSIETVDGPKALHATVANAEGKLVAKSTSSRDKLIIGGSTVAGAVFGKVAGGSTKSTIIGAVGGAVVGTGAVLASKGHELEIPEGAKVSLRVDKPIVIVQR